MKTPYEYQVQVSTHGGNFQPISEPFFVPTPVPYVVDLGHWGTPAKKAAAADKLIAACQLLYEVLGLLGISLMDARSTGLTLNVDTRDKLMSIAFAQDNQEALNKIMERTW